MNDYPGVKVRGNERLTVMLIPSMFTNFPQKLYLCEYEAII